MLLRVYKGTLTILLVAATLVLVSTIYIPTSDVYALHNLPSWDDHAGLIYDPAPTLNLETQTFVFVFNKEINNLNLSKIKIGDINLQQSVTLDDATSSTSDNMVFVVSLTDKQIQKIKALSRIGKVDFAQGAAQDNDNISSKRVMATIVVTKNANSSDLTAPIITLQGKAKVTVESINGYKDAGATCKDSLDGAINPTTLQWTSKHDSNKHFVAYKCVDLAGNYAVPVIRTISIPEKVDSIESSIDKLTATAIKSNSISLEWPVVKGHDNYVLLLINLDNRSVLDMVHTVDTSYTFSDLESDTKYAIMLMGSKYKTLWLIDERTRSHTLDSLVADTTPPVITITGSSSVTINVNDTYTDAGATCNDAVDGSINPTSTSTVNTATAGTYKVTYACTDAAGNTASPVSRTVTVSNISLSATLSGSNATFEGHIIPPVRYQTIAAIAPDTIVIVWSAIDYVAPFTVTTVKSGTSQFTRSTVFDTFHIITGLNPSTSYDVYVLDQDGFIGPLITISTLSAGSDPKFLIPVIKDNSDLDVTPPIITLNGKSTITITTTDDKFEDPFATCTDDRDGSIELWVDDTLDSSEPGTYTTTFYCEDEAGNSAIPVVRTVIVVEGT